MTTENKPIVFKVSEEDKKLLKLILDCNPQWTDSETLTVENLLPLKTALIETQRQTRQEDLKNLVSRIIREGYGDVQAILSIVQGYAEEHNIELK